MPQLQNVLIVEDSEEIGRLVEISLDHAGLASHYCNSAIKAIAFLEEIMPEKPDLIILDIGMPEMSGWEFLEIIRRQDYLRDVKVVITTAFGDAANRVVGKLQEVDAYITKPYGPDELLRVIGSLPDR